MDASIYIAEQVPILQALHAQLDLPPTALADDKARIDAAVRAAIVSVVRSREDEVAQWEAQIADGRRAIVGLARAVGDKGRSVVAAGRRASEEGEPLPAQHERLIRQTEELEQVYNERLAKVEKLLAAIEQLSVLLGPPFEPPPPLQPVPGAAAVPARAQRASSVSNAQLAPGSRKRNSSRAGRSTASPEPTPQSWLDVSEHILDSLQEALDKALDERDVRLAALESLFNDLLWYHGELGLPPLPGDSGSCEFPSHLLPPRSEEEQPGAHARYERTLGRIQAANEDFKRETDEGHEIAGMDGIEPEVGLSNWAVSLLDIWTAERERREARIQELYEKIEPLWTRLELPQDFIDVFIDSNQGCGEDAIIAYEEELERVLELRRSSLSSFVIGVRNEIARLQDELLMSDDAKLEFGGFIDDNYTEDLLKDHEDEAERLRACAAIMGPLLPRVKEWHALKEDEEELERNALDPNRFKKRGPAMLREEKMRKRVEKLKPKVEAELLKALPIWEEEHGQAFCARGDRVVDLIENAIAAKEAAKEAKKRAKMGHAAGGQAPLPRHATPAASSRSVSMASSRSASTMASRKRVAPTPTPILGAGMGLKRPRIASAASTARTVSTASSRYEPHATPTPAMAAARRFGQPAVSARSNGVPVQSTPNFKALPPPRDNALGKAGGRRPPRKSFRPRQSVAGGLLSGRLAGVGEALSEDEDEDVF